MCVARYRRPLPIRMNYSDLKPIPSTCNTFVKDYDGKMVITNSDLKLQSETLIWAAGVTGAPVNGLKAETLMERSNRYIVNEFNQIIGYNNIFALGDVARGSPSVFYGVLRLAKAFWMAWRFTANQPGGVCDIHSRLCDQSSRKRMTALTRINRSDKCC